MEHRGTQTIRTERLVLRQLTYRDVEAMFFNWASDEEVTRYLSWSPHADVTASWSVIDSWVKAYQRPDFYQWGIELSGVLIGSIGGHSLDEPRQAIEVGYVLGRPWWGQGIMTEALAAVLAYFLELGFRQVNARHRLENPASGRVMQKCGMTYQGVLPANSADAQGRLHDMAWYAILARP